MSDSAILRQLAAYVLPQGNPEYRWRIGAALALLVASKGLNVAVSRGRMTPGMYSRCQQQWLAKDACILCKQFPCHQDLAAAAQGCQPCRRMKRGACLRRCPFTFKYAVDALTLDPSGATLTTSPILPLLPATMLAAYGVARIASSACNELRSAVFAKVGPGWHQVTAAASGRQATSRARCCHHLRTPYLLPTRA